MPNYYSKQLQPGRTVVREMGIFQLKCLFQILQAMKKCIHIWCRMSIKSNALSKVVSVHVEYQQRDQKVSGWSNLISIVGVSLSQLCFGEIIDSNNLLIKSSHWNWSNHPNRSTYTICGWIQIPFSHLLSTLWRVFFRQRQMRNSGKLSQTHCQACLNCNFNSINNMFGTEKAHLILHWMELPWKFPLLLIYICKELGVFFGMEDNLNQVQDSITQVIWINT